MTYQPTQEQQAVIDACATGDGVVVQAAAGAGKTSTLRFAAEAMAGRRVMYLAYNRAAADDARRSFPSHVECKTFHSLAFGDFRTRFGHRLRAPRRTARDTANDLRINRDVAIGGVLLTSIGLTRIALDAVRLFCRSADAEITKAHMPRVEGISWEDREELATEVMPVARHCWEDITNPEGTAVKYEHDHYLKQFQLSAPSLPYDVVMLDEAQDSNPCRSSIVLRQQAQRIAIGDSMQQLYAWQGAVDAMRDWPAEHQLTLTQSWRFGQTIANRANEWLEQLETSLRVRGNPAMESVIGSVPRPDAVLCRTVGGTIAQVMAALEQQIPVALVGGTSALVSLCDAAVDLTDGRRTSHPELWPFPDWHALVAYTEESGGSDLRTFVDLVQRHGAQTLRRVLGATVDERRAQLVVSTAHRSKGREWDRLRIANDFRPPAVDLDANTIAPIDPAEAMLAYVAVTRARTALDPQGLDWLSGYQAVAARARFRRPDGTLLVTEDQAIAYAAWRKSLTADARTAVAA